MKLELELALITTLKEVETVLYACLCILYKQIYNKNKIDNENKLINENNENTLTKLIAELKGIQDKYTFVLFHYLVKCVPFQQQINQKQPETEII